MLKKPPRYNGKLVVTENKHKNANEYWDQQDFD